MDAPTITVVKDGGSFGHPQADMGNVGLTSWSEWVGKETLRMEGIPIIQKCKPPLYPL